MRSDARALVGRALAALVLHGGRRDVRAGDDALAHPGRDVVNNTMLIQIAVLAWLVLDESLGPQQITGLSLAALGVLVVQLRGIPLENGWMSRRRPGRPTRRGVPTANERVEVWPDGEWVVRQLTGSAATKPYRCPGCDQLIPPATPHVVAWPVEGATLSGGGTGERRHWHTGCWRRRDRRRPR